MSTYRGIGLPDQEIEVNAFLLLRPPGGGISTFSAGRGRAEIVQRELYGESNPKKIIQAWKNSWRKLKDAKVALLGVPLDTGTAIRRGAAYGPEGVRLALLKIPKYKKWLKDGVVVDIGDVYVNPHLLHDEMLSQSQIKACRKAMYSDVPANIRKKLAVSALSQVKQILSCLAVQFPHLKIFIIGGDHSVAWPVTEVLHRRFSRTLGIVQPDAHTDLLSSRLGVKYCYTTWSYHASKLLGGNGKLVQLGIRQTLKSKKHWESTTGVKQYWAKEITARNQTRVIEEIVAHLRARGIKHVYFSNDIDGTDEQEASATGTPAPRGLQSQFLLKVIKRLGDEFDLVAADVMEVAPDLGPTAKASKRTCNLAARYAVACIEKQVVY